MTDAQKIERWIDRFPLLHALSPAHLQIARGTVHFPVLDAGAIAYELDGECANYLMCLEGRTRIFRMSEGGREVLIYKVGPGGTCALTTQCLLSGGTFPAQSVAEERTELAALPVSTFQHLMGDSAAFRSFVLDDYTRLMSGLFTLIDEVAFAPLKQRLAQRLLAEADPRGVVAVTHQKLADDVGSVREVVSRLLGQWAEVGLIELRRGAIEIVDRSSLAAKVGTDLECGRLLSRPRRIGLFAWVGSDAGEPLGVAVRQSACGRQCKRADVAAEPALNPSRTEKQV